MRFDCFKKATDHEFSGNDDEIALPYDERKRSRGKGISEKGASVAWFLDRGEYLLGGDILVSTTDDFFSVKALPEPVSRVTATDNFALTRIAYHLGNRHVALEVREDELLYQPDYVLDQMVIGLGGFVDETVTPFQPEEGAYHAHSKH
ncbi:MAG: urease accessory protein UreE [Gammaproteobacteria bacterium]|nr:urease accessory protein UreE [Gammaproteobacteria bacterium]|tara:strand:- start:224 stop:667 length:444 start_codon:yes stop_codon:yes gene_type:complete